MEKSRLKSLELHGYKTFASRTLFEFPGLITAVVGPNGSGKSNIADSLRWVLGEQSYSILRGRKTEDMIFSGSEHRPRGSMASASILFDNSDGWLPIDFSEVVLTRRAYRDGQNEYLLNGQRVRLKEIAELLAQSGLAERTYTIIGQGLVDAALSLKPEERRRFFEEAAGIGLYRSRKEESLNRLENTRRNLERVQDILVELEPRLLSLEKQAKRVMEYERIRADLRLLLRDWYGYHWHKVQQDQAQARDLLRKQEARQQQAREKLDEINAQIEAKRGVITALRNQLNELHTQSADLHREREKINRDLAVMAERQRANLEQKQNLQADLGRLVEERHSLEIATATLQSELNELQEEYKETLAKTAFVRNEYEARLKDRELVEAAVNKTREQLVSLETRQVSLRAHRAELKQRQENLEKSVRTLQASLDQELKNVIEAQKMLDEATLQRDQLDTERAQLLERLNLHQRELRETESLKREEVETKANLDAERVRLHARMEVLDLAERSFTGLNQGARFLLQIAQQGKLKGRYRALSSLIQVSHPYEKAITAVLGEFLDGILVEGVEFPDDALELLAEGEKGRVVLFTQLLQPNIKISEVVNDPDCLGVASDLVEVSDQFLPFIRAILGQAFVMKNRAAARRLSASAPPGIKFVTVNGEVFTSGGVVVAGQDGRAGVVSRPREKKELGNRLQEVESHLLEITEKISDREKSLIGLREICQELEIKLRSVDQELRRATQHFQHENLLVEQAKQRLEWQRNRLVETVNQIEKTIKEIELQQAELDELDNEVKQTNEKLRTQAQVLAKIPLEELQSEVAYWSTNLAVTERAVKEAQRRFDEHSSQVQNEQQQIVILQERLNSIETAIHELSERQSLLQEEENRLNTSIERLQTKIRPGEIELAGLEDQYTRAQADQAAAQQALLVSERYATQAQLEANRIRERLESLRRRIEDDFGLVAFEYSAETIGQSPLPLDGMVEQLPMLAELPPDVEELINRQRAQLRRMGAINPDAQKEYQEVKERFEFLTRQVADLKQADADLREVISELDELMKNAFRQTFEEVAVEFKQMFTRLFGGGSARLVLDDEDHPNESGIEIEARLPGRREQGLSLLSGGERSLTAVALIFSLLKISPTPFCVLDEVDAMLDESNVGRFCDLLKELSQKTQFIVITHNRNTVQVAEVIYGVTMGRDSASQVISLRLDEVGDELVR